VMVGVIFRICCFTGFRISEVLSLQYGSFLTATTREEVDSTSLKCIGIKIIGKCENLAKDYQKGKSVRKCHLQQMYRNRKDSFFFWPSRVSATMGENNELARGGTK